MLVESLTAEFEPQKYRDEYREQVLDLIGRKAAGEEFELPAAAAWRGTFGRRSAQRARGQRRSSQGCTQAPPDRPRRDRQEGRGETPGSPQVGLTAARRDAAMTSASDLERFRAGYRHDFDTALAEINRGRKRSHWMWFIFPQVAGLGSSPTAAQYAIGSRSEAEAFLRDPTLGPSYRQLVEAVWQQVVGNGVSVRALFGRPDDQKLVSSLTLFGTVAAGLGDEWAPTVARPTPCSTSPPIRDCRAAPRRNGSSPPPDGAVVSSGAGDEQREQGSGGEERPERVRLVAAPNQHESEPGDSGESEPGNESDGDGREADVAEVDAEQRGEPNVAVTEAAAA